jgi:hypothetical protein
MDSGFLQEVRRARHIFLWGAASAGHRAYFRLINAGVSREQIRFIDSNFKFIESVMGLPVESPSTLSRADFTKDVVFISSTIKSQIIASAPSEIVKHLKYNHELIFSRDVIYKYPDPFVNYIKENGDALNLDIEEAFNLWDICSRIQTLSGIIVEIGVYKGASLKLMALASNSNSAVRTNLIGIDTFEGIPNLIGHGDEKFAGYLSDVDFEKIRFDMPPEVHLIKGTFPDCMHPQQIDRVKLLHLDVDTYKTTKDGLEYFWPKLPQGGVVCIHDYNSQGCPGVKDAADEFIASADCTSFEIAESQLLLVKI